MTKRNRKQFWRRVHRMLREIAVFPALDADWSLEQGITIYLPAHVRPSYDAWMKFTEFSQALVTGNLDAGVRMYSLRKNGKKITSLHISGEPLEFLAKRFAFSVEFPAQCNNTRSRPIYRGAVAGSVIVRLLKREIACVDTKKVPEESSLTIAY